MREIKFRARTIDGSRWVYGDYLNWCGKVPMIYEHEVLPSGKVRHRKWLVDAGTVGQYLNMQDRHGEDIYEGDILNVYGHYVTIDIKTFGYVLFSEHPNFELDKDEINRRFPGRAEIVGNMTENSDILYYAKKCEQ